VAYCLPSDLYLYGLPRGALASPGRLVEAVSTTDGTFELDAHGFADDTVVQFRTAGGGTLPTPIVAGTSYYVVAVDDWHFSVAASAGGSAIALTDEGTTFAVFAPLPITDAIAKASRMIDDMLPAHVVPLADPVADIIRMTAAELAASELLAMTGGASTSLTAVYDIARKRIERWARGVPVRGTNAPTSAQKAITSASSRPIPPWRRYGGIA